MILTTLIALINLQKRVIYSAYKKRKERRKGQREQGGERKEGGRKEEGLDYLCEHTHIHTNTHTLSLSSPQTPKTK